MRPPEQRGLKPASYRLGPETEGRIELWLAGLVASERACEQVGNLSAWAPPTLVWAART